MSSLQGRVIRLCEVNSDHKGVTDVIGEYPISDVDWTAVRIPLPTSKVDEGLLLYSPPTGEYQVLDDELILLGAGQLPSWGSHFLPFRSEDPQKVEPRLLIYSSTDGTACFYEVAQSKTGVKLLHKNSVQWNCGWTHFIPYRAEVNPGRTVPRYFAYKYSTGAAAFCELNGNGFNFTTLCRTNNQGPGWSSVMPYDVGGEPHLFFYAYGNGNVKFCRLLNQPNGNNDMCEPALDAAMQPVAGLFNHSPGWTHFVPYWGLGDATPRYIAYKYNSGSAAICSITYKRSTAVDTHLRAKWGAQCWSHFITFGQQCKHPNRFVVLLGCPLITDALHFDCTSQFVDKFSMPVPLGFQLMQYTSAEGRWNEIEKRLQESLPGAQVQKLFRVCHPQLYQRFRDECRSVEMLRKGHQGNTPSRICAWHGTDALSFVTGIDIGISPLPTIDGQVNALNCESNTPRSWSDAGFNLLFSTGGAYGRGAYFARHARYSVEIGNHTKCRFPGNPYRCVLILVEVELGNCYDYGNAIDRQLKRAPNGFDSVEGTESSFAVNRFTLHTQGKAPAPVVEDARQYIVFQRYRAYPHFIVEFTF
jgi:hypothetical protein